MLSAFDLAPGADETEFRALYDAFVNQLLQQGLIVTATPVGRRLSATPMDTDRERSQEFFSVMGFSDRSQLDAAYAHIESRLRPATAPHSDMYRHISNAVFLCWQDDGA